MRSTSRSRTQSPRTVRIVAGFLAVAWLVGGAAAIVVAISQSHVLLAVAAIAALWYGVLWLRVARLGRLLTPMEALAPWRAKSHSDA